MAAKRAGPPARRFRPSPLDVVALAAPLVVFGGVAGPYLSLPGLYYDEAADAVPAMQLLLGQPVELVRQTGVELFGRTLPLMAFDYVGAVHTYAVLPFFAIFGVGTVPLRLMTVTGGALTIVQTFFWTRWLFGSRWIAFATALLLATHPSFVFYVRQGVHVSSLMALWAMAALCLLLAWRRTGNGWWLAPAAFFLGLGLSTKILFLWFILALLAIYLLWRAPLALGRMTLGEKSPSLSGREGAKISSPVGGEAGFSASTLGRGIQLLSALGAFALGASMLILYNLKTGGTLEVLLKNAAVSQYGVPNTDYLNNLLARLDSLRALLDGGHFWFLGGVYANPWYPVAFGLSLAFTFAILLLKTEAQRYRLGAAFLVALGLLVLVQSPFTLSGIYPTHLFILLPLLHAMVALGLYLFGRYGLPRFGLGVASAALLFLVASSIVVDLQYRDALMRTGGLRGHSDAVNHLAMYLDASRVPEPVAMDWGIKYNVQLLTQGRVRPLEVFQYTAEPDEAFYRWLSGALTTSQRVYLFHGEHYTIFPRLDAFTRLAQSLEKEVHLEKTFRERDGTPLYLVYSAR